MSEHKDTILREEKWRESFKRFSGWDTDWQRDIQKKEAGVMAKWLLELQLPRYDILEVGCGNGYFGTVLIEKLQAAGVEFTYHFTDFLPECVEQAREATRSLNVPDKLSFSVLDVYEIDAVLSPESQQIIVSTGFVSPVTYVDAVPKVARVLRSDGVLVCDFVNHFSSLVFFSRPLSSALKLARSLYLAAVGGPAEARYHFGLLGVRPYFKEHGLELARHGTIRLRRNPLLCMFQKR